MLLVLLVVLPLRGVADAPGVGGGRACVVVLAPWLVALLDRLRPAGARSRPTSAGCWRAPTATRTYHGAADRASGTSAASRRRCTTTRRWRPRACAIGAATTRATTPGGCRSSWRRGSGARSSSSARASRRDEEAFFEGRDLRVEQAGVAMLLRARAAGGLRRRSCCAGAGGPVARCLLAPVGARGLRHASSPTASRASAWRRAGDRRARGGRARRARGAALDGARELAAVSSRARSCAGARCAARRHRRLPRRDRRPRPGPGAGRHAAARARATIGLYGIVATTVDDGRWRSSASGSTRRSCSRTTDDQEARVPARVHARAGAVGAAGAGDRRARADPGGRLRRAAAARR